MLQAAARSPSGTNMQPWRVYVLTGEVRDQLVQEVLARRELEPHREKPPKPFGEYDYNPEPLFEPYLTRRRTVGFALYQLLGVAKGDRAASWSMAGRPCATQLCAMPAFYGGQRERWRPSGDVAHPSLFFAPNDAR
ncbi:nitroreductase family protein [Bradyrhizobium liaoningense]